MSDYTTVNIVESNLNNLNEVTKDVYLVEKEFTVPEGTEINGKPCNKEYTIEIGWVILTDAETEIINDYIARFGEAYPKIVKAIQKAKKKGIMNNTIRAGKNTWVCLHGHEFKSKEKPRKCPKCGIYEVAAKYPKSRIHGSRYRYYAGATEWEQDANRGMAAEAKRNFRKLN